jgi:hypothetical protein
MYYNFLKNKMGNKNMRLLDFLGGNTDCLFESSLNSDLAFDLFEDYGNLNTINKKMLKVFHVGTSKSNTDLAVVGRNSNLVKLNDPLRSGAKTFDFYWKQFASNDKAIGLVLTVNEKQIISFAQMDKMDKKGKFNVVGLIPDNIIDLIENESIIKHIEDINFKRSPVSKPATYLRDILDEIIKQCVNNDFTFECNIITSDEDRAQKGASRKEAQAGVIPLPGQRGYETYVKSLTAELRSKLKSSKIEELTTLLKRNGALAEFEYEGLTYVKYASSIDLTKLQDGGTVYIEYKANRNEVRDALNSGKKVPTYIKVYLKQGRNGLSLDIDSVELK